MALQILSSPDGTDVAQQMRDAIEEAIPGAEVAVTPATPGHFEVRVTSGVFEGKGRVAQQQLVYAAIAPLMRGNAAPVHAIDRLETLTA